MSARLQLVVSVQNRAGRKGVPIARSFESWVRAALAGQRSGRIEVGIALFGEAEARRLNREYRGKDYATNVLSFPYASVRGERSAMLGDLALCPAVVAREAREQRKPVRDHFAHLTVHGLLHLIGYDHERKHDAARMEAIERRVLSGFGIPNPYE
jgi:probable rRNA maturation factor